jgi:hypothetical protein
MLTQAQILEAIEQVKVTCDLYMPDYTFISMRSGLRTCGYDADDIDQVIRYCYDNGFKNCLDHSVLSHGVTPAEYPSQDVCFWGPDQLKSRLDAL